MCDCYTHPCAVCGAPLPLHIADFCMERDEIEAFCAKHAPGADAIVYELVDEGPPWEDDDETVYGEPGWEKPPRAWRMAIRYHVAPPFDHGLTAATPNLGRGYLAEVRNVDGGRTFFTNRAAWPVATEVDAIEAHLADIAGSAGGPSAEDPAFGAALRRETLAWQALQRQAEVVANVPEIVLNLPLLKGLRERGELTAVVLIGSVASRDYVPGLSDLDLWILGRRAKPGLHLDTVQVGGEDLEVNLVVRNAASLGRALDAHTPVDLVALRHGVVLEGHGVLVPWQRRAARTRANEATRQAWMTSSTRWLTRTWSEYIDPSCAHCFFSGLYHAARDLLRAHLVAAGDDLVEGPAVQEAVAARWPHLAEAFHRIRRARADWEAFEFPLFVERTKVEGPLGRLIEALDAIAGAVYAREGLALSTLVNLFDEVGREGKLKRVVAIEASRTPARVLVFLEGPDGKLGLEEIVIPRVGTDLVGSNSEVHAAR